MTEEQARDTLAKLLGTPPIPGQGKIERVFQIAKQIGSSWPTDHINLIWLGYEYRIVIE